MIISYKSDVLLPGKYTVFLAFPSTQEWAGWGMASSGVSMFSNNLLDFGLDCPLFGNSVVSLTNNSRGTGNRGSNTVPGTRRSVVSNDGAEYCAVTVGVPDHSILVSTSSYLSL